MVMKSSCTYYTVVRKRKVQGVNRVKVDFAVGELAFLAEGDLLENMRDRTILCAK